ETPSTVFLGGGSINTSEAGIYLTNTSTDNIQHFVGQVYLGNVSDPAVALRLATFGDGWPATFDNFAVQSVLVGDFNNDGKINAADIKTMENALASNTSDPSMVPLGDFNGDGRFTSADLQLFLSYLKSGYGSEGVVPEPTSFALFGMG